MTTRRFPPPWRPDKMLGGYVVCDANGQALAYIYLREGLNFVRNALIGIVSAFDIARAMALGADWCNAARGASPI